MNIFDQYLDKIKNVLLDLSKNGNIVLPERMDGITAEIPPAKFNSDISTNVAMVLSKANNKSPLDLANILVKAIKEKDELIDNISVVKPGFINIKFKPIFWTMFVKEIIKNSDNYGINTNEKKQKYLIEFVSANPTGPLHVGHSRGAILGDVIANILLFNKHKVSREYYVNDYGNQIINFTKSVYLRIREILFKEPFPLDNENLYPGDYLISFAENIIKFNKEIDFNNFDEISEKLTTLSIDESLKLIKKNLKSLGVNHDNFFSEKKLVSDNEVEKVIDFLKKKNFVYKGKIKKPEGDNNENWVEREQLLFKSTDLAMIKIEPYKKLTVRGLILLVMLPITKTN